jgi:hypothetical protein
MNCPTCKHAYHPVGQCRNCNCGESARSHSSWTAAVEMRGATPDPYYYREAGGLDAREQYGRMRSRFYNRRGQPRKEFRQ